MHPKDKEEYRVRFRTYFGHLVTGQALAMGTQHWTQQNMDDLTRVARWCVAEEERNVETWARDNGVK